MKKLTRMKLINWHRFTDCTIDFGNSTLLSGENGAGKSTLLDAIQFVITCSTNYFNKAAHENGKRKLTGYIRCKTGRENKPYERTGAVSAHIALEFYEESKKQYFIVGAVIDSASEGQETTVRYLIDNSRMSEDMFVNGKNPKTITEFRSYNKKIKQWYKTQVEAKKMMKSRFGRIEDKFFSLIPKALAFKPIDDIKDFVYSYVLDEKEVNIDTLHENVRSYQELEKTLDGVKKRIAKLEIIEKNHIDVLDTLKKNKMYDFFISNVELDIIKEDIQSSQSYIKSEEFRLLEENKVLQELMEEKSQKQEMETSLRVEMRQNIDFIALEEQKKKLEVNKEEELNSLEEKKELKKSVKIALDNVYKLQEVKDINPCITQYQKYLEGIEKISDVAEVKKTAEKVIQYKGEMFIKTQQKRVEVQIRLNEKMTERNELNQKMERLARKQLSYPEAVLCLNNSIKEEFERIGREATPRVLCELLDITDNSWRNAVEGYLNTQRFYILVEPENFDIALGVYDKLRKCKKVYGVGLINTQKMDAYDVAPIGTLATVVTSKNQYAKRYINMILGKVQMCDHYGDLKKYDTSITKECMKYQNRVASAIKPVIFEVPFIGSNAIKIQLEQATKQKILYDSEIREDNNRIKNLESVIEPLKTESDVDIKYRLDVLSKLVRIQAAIKNCKDNIVTLEKNATLIQKQIQLNVLEKMRKDLENIIGNKNQEIGKLIEKVNIEKEKIEQLLTYQIRQGSIVMDIYASAGDDIVIWMKEYDKQTEQKTYEQFKENYNRRKKANETIKSTVETKMIENMIDYKTEFNFGAPSNMDGFFEFSAVYDRLITSELLTYEEKVLNARIAAEEEFREQFLSKLQENMKQAQNEFKKLNTALKDINFSNEKYEFLYVPSKRYRSYYEMIMDDFNAMQGESIFNGMFNENHKEVIDELFAKLALDSDNGTKSLDEFTDYRTYMDYDIKIIHSDNNYSYYSKVCEEKSGGETQTPFYVTVAASFVQLYNNNIGGEAIGLVMFDEAFNNMDDERIGGVLEFLGRLPLQIIISAPPDKIQYISPSMESTLLVMTNEKVSYVEEYHNDAIRQANFK